VIGGVQSVRGGAVLLVVLAAPCAASQASDCRVLEYPDHYEAICIGTPSGSAAQEKTAQMAVQQQPLPPSAAPREGEAGQVEIVRSGLGKRHAESWLKMQKAQ